MFFFVSYTIVSILLLNVVVAVLLDNFTKQVHFKSNFTKQVDFREREGGGTLLSLSKKRAVSKSP